MIFASSLRSFLRRILAISHNSNNNQDGGRLMSVTAMEIVDPYYVRVGCAFEYSADYPTPMVILVGFQKYFTNSVAATGSKE